MEGQSTREQRPSMFRLFGATSEQARRATGSWWLYVLLGLVSIALGAYTLSTRVNALTTLVILFGIFFLYAGVVEMTMGVISRQARWLAIVAGVASIAAGIVALAWPSITLFVLALFVGWGLLVWGVYNIYLSLSDPVVRPRAITLAGGIIMIALGVLALAEPGITLVVLAAIVGIAFIAYGVAAFVAGLRLADLHRELRRSEKTVPEETQLRRAA